MIMPTQIRVTDDRRRALLATAARAQHITAESRPSRSFGLRPVGIVPAGLRWAVAALVALAARLNDQSNFRPTSGRRSSSRT